MSLAPIQNWAPETVPVPMQDAGSVGVGEAAERLNSDDGDALDVERPVALDAFAEIFSSQKLHDEIGPPVGQKAHIEDVNDVLGLGRP